MNKVGVNRTPQRLAGLHVGKDFVQKPVIGEAGLGAFGVSPWLGQHLDHLDLGIAHRQPVDLLAEQQLDHGEELVRAGRIR